MYENPYGNPVLAMGTLLALTAQAKARFNALPPEEQDRINSERAAKAAYQNLKNHLSQGICPECKSKLERGKKDKRNGYKRSWFCPKCNTNFSL